MTKLGSVIPNARRDLLNLVLSQHLEILHFVQDDETGSRHPECNERCPDCGTESVFGDPSLRLG
ncbi:hypothetical protein [Legionella quateirensis]|uniref:hypothetical protein n=1 Tax=Legionella quateirensis TaxID=45072 RepID=UPI0011C0245D|nr:hypothetical protein [Legionella quateirensis]